MKGTNSSLEETYTSAASQGDRLIWYIKRLPESGTTTFALKACFNLIQSGADLTYRDEKLRLSALDHAAMQNDDIVAEEIIKRLQTDKTIAPETLYDLLYTAESFMKPTETRYDVRRMLATLRAEYDLPEIPITRCRDFGPCPRP